MGNTCTTQQKEQFEDKVEDAVDAVKEVVEDVKEKAEEAVEQAKEIAEDVKEKVEDIVEPAKEAVADATEKAQEVAETAQERVVEAVAEAKEIAADAAEGAAGTMTAAAAAVTGTMIVEFDAGKGSTKSVDFKTKELGLAVARGGGGCCVSAPMAKVVVGKVDKNQQADKLGVKRGWTIKAINGTQVDGLEEATKLLEDGKARLAEV